MIEKIPFGQRSDGGDVTLYRLFGKGESHVDILDYGATIQSVMVPDRDGKLTEVVLGYDSPAGYEQGTFYLGATVGRHANRIKDGQFTLGGVTYPLDINSGPNHIHGGFQGYHNRMFEAQVEDDCLIMSLISPDGDQGYPGRLRVRITFGFDGENRLSIHYWAISTKETVVNLTNHSYFDLSGGRNPMGQYLWMGAERYLENDENTLPTGVIANVAGTPFDFLEAKPLGQDIGANHPQLINCGGYDHNFVLMGRGMRVFAQLYSPETGITMIASTDMPGAQLYTGNFLDEPKGRRPYGARSGVALETQYFPNAMAIDHFEKPILPAGNTWEHETIYAFR